MSTSGLWLYRKQLVNPTAAVMRDACDEVEHQLRQMLARNPDLDPESAKTWFDSPGRNAHGRIVITVFGSLETKEART